MERAGLINVETENSLAWFMWGQPSAVLRAQLERSLATPNKRHSDRPDRVADLCIAYSAPALIRMP